MYTFEQRVKRRTLVQQVSSYATRCSFRRGAVTFKSINQLSTTFGNGPVSASSSWTHKRQATPAHPSKRKHGLSADQFPVSAYVGSSKNLKDLKGPRADPLLVWRKGSAPTPCRMTGGTLHGVVSPDQACCPVGAKPPGGCGPWPCPVPQTFERPGRYTVSVFQVAE